MKNNDLTEKEKVYVNWTDEQLVKATTVEKNDYNPEAVDIMLKVLQKRGVSEKQLNSLQSEVEQKVAADIKKITGVGGFLIVFLIILVLSVIYSLNDGFSVLSSIKEMPILLLVVSIPFFLISIYGAYIFLLLVRKKEKAPDHTIKWLIAHFCVRLLGVVAIFITTGKLELSAIAPMSTLVWLMYFTNSKRVKATYGGVNI